MWDLRDGTLAVDYAEETDLRLSFVNLCYRPQGHCFQRSVLAYWGFNRTFYEETVQADEHILAHINTYAGPWINPRPLMSRRRRQRHLGVGFPDDVVREARRGGHLRGEPHRTAFECRGCYSRWELAWLDYVLNDVEIPHATVHPSASRSVEDAFLAGAIDVGMLALACGLMISFICFSISKGFDITCRKTRASLAIVGVLGVGLAIITGYGLCLWCGVPFTAIAMALSYIIFGVGVDDMFIITNSFDSLEFPPGMPVSERIGNALGRCGVSILYTSATDFCAFMLGSMSNLPGIEYMCRYAAVAILCDFLLQVTFFVAFLSMDMQRLERGLPDFALWCAPLWIRSVPRRELQVAPSSAMMESPETNKKGDADGAGEREVGAGSSGRAAAEVAPADRVLPAVLPLVARCVGDNNDDGGDGHASPAAAGTKRLANARRNSSMTCLKVATASNMAIAPGAPLSPKVAVAPAAGGVAMS
uniref:SSD domain-containing protein n=1 Tax=Phaeomonas parva TaxID=124430 RepID=A0A7S1UKD5_9STRA|mmetsp:Transcript_6455/g.18285  ORF Transcript_6455/g.18285 Transcript_6455/m.18285 type:complete len:476 (+) Transcript_6455:541-1968(+)